MHRDYCDLDCPVFRSFACTFRRNSSFFRSNGSPVLEVLSQLEVKQSEIGERLTPAGRVTNRVSPLILPKKAERSEAKRSKRSFASEYYELKFLTESFASRF